VIIRTEPVPGTSRQRVITDDGSTLERQFIYLEPHQWDALRVMANRKRTSGSHIVAELIKNAVKFGKQ
jgi:predicted DNA-binding ribbon-helix-helix protein